MGRNGTPMYRASGCSYYDVVVEITDEGCAPREMYVTVRERNGKEARRVALEQVSLGIATRKTRIVEVVKQSGLGI